MSDWTSPSSNPASNILVANVRRRSCGLKAATFASRASSRSIRHRWRALSGRPRTGLAKSQPWFHDSGRDLSHASKAARVAGSRELAQHPPQVEGLERAAAHGAREEPTVVP